MIEPLNRFSRHISSRLKRLKVIGYSVPSEPVIRALLDIAYYASLKTEEGRFVGGSMTFANPKKPDTNPPLTRRADYPSFTAFQGKRNLTVDNFVKLSRAINNWTGSIAVYGTSKSNLVIWGVVDQLLQQNIRMNREITGGFSSPGILRINVDGVGALSVYHESVFLCSLKQDQIVMREHDAFQSSIVAERILPELSSRASQIALALGDQKLEQELLEELYSEWTDVVSRLCIGLRRMGTGGSLLITPTPVSKMLDIVYQFPYSRLGEAFTLKVLDKQYLLQVKEKLDGHFSSNSLPSSLILELNLAEADEEDRVDELTGAVKLVTSLASSDGLVLMTPPLEVLGFGVKIGSGKSVRTVYNGALFTRKHRVVKRIDISEFGTRHSSMLRYCRADRNAIGIVVSQDGHVRLITTIGKNLVMWENVKLLSHHSDMLWYAKNERRSRKYRDKRRDETSLGFTNMPKTIEALLRYGKG